MCGTASWCFHVTNTFKVLNKTAPTQTLLTVNCINFDLTFSFFLLRLTCFHYDAFYFSGCQYILSNLFSFSGHKMGMLCQHTSAITKSTHCLLVSAVASRRLCATCLNLPTLFSSSTCMKDNSVAVCDTRAGYHLSFHLSNQSECRSLFCVN